MIRVEQSGPIHTVTLDRPEKRNALTPDMLDALVGAFESVPDDARAIVFHGSGKAFCAGFDLRLCAADPGGGTMRALLTGLSRTVLAMRAARAPVVLAVHGSAIAGGCALLGGADIVVSDRDAVLGYPVVKIGVSPGVSAPFLAASIPDGPARALLLDPDLIPATDAQRIGLVHELADSPTSALERARVVAHRLAAKPGIGVATTKQLCNELAASRTAMARTALDTSLSLAGSEEERARLADLWS